MRWACGPFEVEMIDEPMHTFGSADNAHSYTKEMILGGGSEAWVLYGLKCYVDGEEQGSLVLGAEGGMTCVRERSCLMFSGFCFVGIGCRLALLNLPDLSVRWEAKADWAACFGLLLTPDQRHIVVHGEVAISLFTLDGVRVWEYHGADIFTGACDIRDGAVAVSDFNGMAYAIELTTGVLRRG